jgi:predicted 3-demethylubiquinone-9 3-methyltransferase (glyoxalase superfamily)
MAEITTFLTFGNQAEAATNLYVSLFDGKIVSSVRYGQSGPGPAGSVMSVTFEILGKTFYALNGGPHFSFSQGISLFVSCDSQAEIDRYYDTLLADGGKEMQCGWLSDRFGVVWQIVPKVLPTLIGGPDPKKSGRAMQAMLQMKKLDIATLKRAYEGTESS